MTMINKTRDKSYKDYAHKNFMDGNSWDISDPIAQLEIMACSCFFGEPRYYGERVTAPTNSEISYLCSVLGVSLLPERGTSTTTAGIMEDAIDKALEHDVVATLQFAVRLRQNENIRTTPQVILVRAANAYKHLSAIREYGQQIVSRMDEPSVGMAYQLSEFGKPIPNSLKKIWRAKLQSATDYQLAKYRMDSRTVKTIDVVRLTHANSLAIDALVKGTLKNTDTWESIISAEGSNKASWTSALTKMGHMAVLRNLRNFVKNEVNMTDVISILKEGAETGKQLPFRYFSAYKALNDSYSLYSTPPNLLDAVEECMELSMGNLPRFSGRVTCLVDNSGSAQGTMTSSLGSMTIAEIGNLMGVITAKQADEGYVGVFGDKLATLPIRTNSSILDSLEKVNATGENIGKSTEHGIWLFWRDAIKKSQHWDSVFIYSDMQAGHGGLYGIGSPYPIYRSTSNYIDVPQLITEYRHKVNPNVNVYCVQTAGYSDTIIPEIFPRTAILGGWSDSVLKFAKRMEAMWEYNSPTQ